MSNAQTFPDHTAYVEHINEEFHQLLEKSWNKAAKFVDKVYDTDVQLADHLNDVLQDTCKECGGKGFTSMVSVAANHAEGQGVEFAEVKCPYCND